MAIVGNIVVEFFFRLDIRYQTLDFRPNPVNPFRIDVRYQTLDFRPVNLRILPFLVQNSS